MESGWISTKVQCDPGLIPPLKQHLQKLIETQRSLTPLNRSTWANGSAHSRRREDADNVG